MSGIPKYLTKQEAESLYEAVKDEGTLRDKALFSLLLNYGFRAGEFGLLKVDDIDLEQSTIRTRRLKGGVENVLPILSTTHTVLGDYIDTLDDDEEFLFPGNFASQKKGRGISRKTVYYLLRKYGDKTGIPKKKQHPHACRHYVGVKLMDMGLKLEDVQDLLGHKAITSTQVYAKITNKRRKKVFEAIEEEGTI